MIWLTSIQFKADFSGLGWSSRRKLKGSCTYDLPLDQGKDAVWSLVECHACIFSGANPEQGVPAFGMVGLRMTLIGLQPSAALILAIAIGARPAVRGAQQQPHVIRGSQNASAGR